MVALGVTAALVFLIAPGITHAQLAGLHWSFDKDVYEITPPSYQWLVVTGTFFNDSAEHLYTDGVGGQSLDGHMFAYFDGRVIAGSEFAGLHLDAGKSIPFNIVLLKPKGGWAPPGDYYSEDTPYLNVNGALIYPDNEFVLHVNPGAPPPDLSTVPEVGSLPFVAGLSLALGIVRCRRRWRLGLKA